MVNWKVLAGFSAAGALISLVAGIAGGNRFGTILLRLILSALVAGGLGFAVQFVLRRFLPEIDRGAGKEGAPAVDIVIDDRLDLESPGDEPGAGFTVELPAAGAEGGEGGEAAAGEELGFPPETEAADISPGGAALEEMPGLAEPTELAAEPAGIAESEMPDALQPSAEGAEGEGLSDLDSFAPPSPSSRSLKSRELGAQVDSVVKGQDPASLAKAVRTFLQKDQEG